MPPRKSFGRGRGRGRPPLQRVPLRQYEEESSVYSTPSVDRGGNDDLPSPPQGQQVPPPPCSPYDAFMDWRQRYGAQVPPFGAQVPHYGAAQPSAGFGYQFPPPPTDFTSGAGFDAKDWLYSVISAFEDMNLVEPQRVKIASRLLDEEAKAWWVSVKDRTQGEVTWEMFVSEFLKECNSGFEKTRISSEFLELKEGDMLVSEFSSKLRRLARNMPTDVSRIVPYSHLVDTAKQAELVVEAARKTKQISGFFSRHFKGKGKRHDTDSSYEPSSKKSRSSDSSGGASLGGSVGSPQASRFGKCFQCGSQVHLRKDCPHVQGTQSQAGQGGRFFNTRQHTTAAHKASDRGTSGLGSNTQGRVQTRLYTMTREAAQDNPNSITGTVVLFRNYARALVDTGSEHSSHSIGDYDFDVILGMDWLSMHGAQIDCQTKTLTLKKPDYPVIEFQDLSLPSEDCSNIPVVNEFFDVFPEELPGLPPDREFDFAIDVVPGTNPISIPPYRMAPAELRELKIQDSHEVDEKLSAKLEKLYLGMLSEYSLRDDGVLQKLGRVCVPDNEALKRAILEEAHSSAYALHLGSTKIVPAGKGRTSKAHWNPTTIANTGMESERTIQTLEDMLRACILEFQGSWDNYVALAEFAYINSYQASIGMAPYEALYGRKCRTPMCWNEVGERKLFNVELIDDMVENVKMIRDRLKVVQDRQKSYADHRRRDLEFEVGDAVFLKVSPWKGVILFRKGGKLAPRYIGPFEIVERIGPVAYRLNLPSELGRIHDVFHVSMLRKYVPDPSHVLQALPVELNEKLNFKVQPVGILDRQIKNLRIKQVPIVKVLWKSQAVEEMTWELEEAMRKQYPHLFDSGRPKAAGGGWLATGQAWACAGGPCRTGLHGLLRFGPASRPSLCWPVGPAAACKATT
ncbi:Retrotransposon gag protein [Corchorus capsularis]|uniref:Retrotransposon gag protein n=1 Tax=Corchorus capsularis TaxID=210143 RepID=A0A1R3K321_COCAP|nr:Retrotransposon gag protein [Corchorus capsularis]